jgi:TatD DNase family protein
LTHKLFDAHCHLTFPDFDADRSQVAERAAANGITIVNSSVSPDEVEGMLRLLKEHVNVYWTMGLSAAETDVNKVDDTMAAIRENRDSIIGIGEVGLDYHWVKDETLRLVERENFARFIGLSDEIRMPLVVHSRNAEEHCINMLEENGKNALMHCFSGTLEQAERALKLGCLISIPTNVVYSKQKQELARSVPLDSIVLETDAPYLAPTPKTRNEPLNVMRSVEKIAELKNASAGEVAAKTTQNAMKFFNIK